MVAPGSQAYRRQMTELLLLQAASHYQKLDSRIFHPAIFYHELNFSRHSRNVNVLKYPFATDDWRRQRVGKQVGPRALPQQAHQAPGPGRVAARRAAKRLAEGRVDYVGGAGHAVKLFRAPPGRAKEAGGVALVEKDEGAVPVGQPSDVGQGADVAVHGEDPVRDDQPRPRRRRLLISNPIEKKPD